MITRIFCALTGLVLCSTPLAPEREQDWHIVLVPAPVCEATADGKLTIGPGLEQECIDGLLEEIKAKDAQIKVKDELICWFKAQQSSDIVRSNSTDSLVRISRRAIERELEAVK
jgi:hypothetical protein